MTVPVDVRSRLAKFEGGLFGVAGGAALVALLAFLASRFWSGYPIARAGGVSENGDVNGDNGLDLSDAIYLLTYLFINGPELPEPNLLCGSDPTIDGIGCANNICP